MPDPYISWILIVIFLILHFFFSASETAIALCNKFKVQVKADNGSLASKILLKLIDKYDRTLTIVLVGNNIVAVLLSSITTMLFLSFFKTTGIAEYTVSIIASVILTFVVYIFGDTFPKTVARSIPDTLSFIFAYPLFFFYILLAPISFIFEGFTKLFSKLFKLKDEEEFTEDDFEDALEEASEKDMIDEEQAEIVQSTIDYLDTNVKEVLTPRENIFALNIRNLTNDSLQKILIDTNYSRIPVYDKVFDNVIGILNVKIYFAEISKDPHLNIRSILQKPYFINNKIMIDDLFNGFKRKHTHLAIVRDNRNKVIGMVTMEDVLEEIVSDISEPNTTKRRKS